MGILKSLRRRIELIVILILLLLFTLFLLAKFTSWRFSRSRIVASATLNPWEVDVYSLTKGQICSVAVEIGDSVASGQLLAIAERTTEEKEGLALSLKQAEAIVLGSEISFKNAKRDYERVKRLLRQGAATSYEMERDSIRYELARMKLLADSSILKQRERKGYYQIFAPISGVIIQKEAEPGFSFPSGIVLFTLARLDKLKVIIYLKPKEAERIILGQSASFRCKEIVSEYFPSRVVKIRGNSVELSVDNQKGMLHPGMHGWIEMRVK